MKLTHWLLKKQKLLSGAQTKEANEDVSHIFKGIMMGKGNVHLSICPKITGEFSPKPWHRR